MDNVNSGLGTTEQPNGQVATTNNSHTHNGSITDAGAHTHSITTTQQPNTPVEIEIEGLGKVKVDDIKEWNKGYMRQSDYTKKTQEISAQRKEQQQALEVYNYLKNNPQIAQAIQQGDYSAIQGTPIANAVNPTNNKLESLELKLAHMEIDSTISALKSKYPDFDEVSVLTEAEKRGVSNASDLEFIYHALQGAKVPTMKEQLMAEIRKELTNQIRQNGIETATMIGDNDTSTKEANYGLSEAELVIASNMRLTPEQYAKAKRK